MGCASIYSKYSKAKHTIINNEEEKREKKEEKTQTSIFSFTCSIND